MAVAQQVMRWQRVGAILPPWLIVPVALGIGGCSRGDIGEYFFRVSFERNLVELCAGDDDCVAAVNQQTKVCMAESDFPRLLLSDYRDDELKRFTGLFYNCLVDPLGNPYFELTQ